MRLTWKEIASIEAAQQSGYATATSAAQGRQMAIADVELLVNYIRDLTEELKVLRWQYSAQQRKLIQMKKDNQRYAQLVGVTFHHPQEPTEPPTADPQAD